MKMLNKNLDDLAIEYQNKYQNATPFPNISFTDFFDEKFLDSVLAEFPDLNSIESEKFENKREKKLAGKGDQGFGENTMRLMYFLNSEKFLRFLQKLTGIKETLIGDPYFIGGGLHEIKSGGYLKVHADFNKHKTIGLDRRINVLVYLNKDWKSEWGGQFELWNREMTECVKKVEPSFNTLALFSTSDTSYHGLPDPIKCPKSNSRKSLALYYYTNGRSDLAAVNTELHGTIFKARAGEAADKLSLNLWNDPKGFLRKIVPKAILRSIRRN